MLENAQVCISDASYSHYKLIIHFFRLLGFCPVTITKNDSGSYLKLSPCYLIGGLATGALFVFVAYWGIYLDGNDKKNSIRIQSVIDKLILVSLFTGYNSVYLCGAFINPCRFGRFFAYLKHINEVDSVIKTTHKQLEKYTSGLFLLGVVILNLALSWLDLSDCYNEYGGKKGFMEVLKRYLGLNIVASMSNIAEYTNVIMLGSLERRIRRLNELLERAYLKVVNVDRWNNCVPTSKTSRRFSWGYPKNRGKADTMATVAPVQYNYEDSILQLTKAYLTIISAADEVNDFLGPCTVITILGVLGSLINSLYFFFLALGGKRGEVRDAVEIPENVTYTSFHIFRVLLIIEPPYACLIQIEATKRIVCKLLSCNVNQSYAKKVNRFAVILGLRNLEFSIYGLFSVNRFLFTSFLDTVTTFLVVLLQYRSTTVTV